ncbi:hypothetical protein TSAR_005338 [Trichomalopsis sarcophagae]|uniref:Uncharacterized protein n=1 Tax=Trichomalopsis sarcophagae TaxID=543379 RepID=A0A232FF79_9HYME|nr:hypothetical protein TSAR_005338 [Trichomalopsis sarcophagae]
MFYTHFSLFFPTLHSSVQAPAHFTMKSVVAFFALLAVASVTALPVQNDVYLVNETPSTNTGTGGYQFGYETSDNQSRFETAQLVAVPNARTGEVSNVLSVQGYYSFVDNTGRNYFLVEYTADENGYRPKITYKQL